MMESRCVSNASDVARAFVTYVLDPDRCAVGAQPTAWSTVARSYPASTALSGAASAGVRAFRTVYVRRTSSDAHVRALLDITRIEK